MDYLQENSSCLIFCSTSKSSICYKKNFLGKSNLNIYCVSNNSHVSTDGVLQERYLPKKRFLFHDCSKIFMVHFITSTKMKDQKWSWKHFEILKILSIPFIKYQTDRSICNPSSKNLHYSIIHTRYPSVIITWFLLIST